MSLRARLFTPLLAILLTPPPCHAQSAPAGAPALRTAAETSDYKETTRHRDLLAFLDACAAGAPHLRRLDFGSTVEGRPLAAAIVARPMVADPSELAEDPRLVVLVNANIHSGECAGKEALLMTLRELSKSPEHPWLDDLVLIAIPNLNADGNERVGAHHRPGQVGPSAGTGERANAQGLDLNRDFLKLEAPETRALVALADAWRADCFFDLHTTNGSRHRYRLTYDIPHNPASPARVASYLRTALLPTVTAKLARSGIDSFYYGNLDADRKRWMTFGYEPRYSTEYMGLRGMIAILSEAYAYDSYEGRITSTKAFLGSCLDQLGADRATIKALLADAARAPETLAIAAERVAFPDPVVIKGEERVEADGQSEWQPRDFPVEFHGDYRPTQTAERPFAYALTPEASGVVSLLRRHGVEVERLAGATDALLEQDRVTKLERAKKSFQKHRTPKLTLERRQERGTLPAGSFIVLCDQRLGRLAMTLLEAGGVESLATWGRLDPWLAEGRDLPIARLPEPAPLITEGIAELKPTGRLELSHIYGPDRRLSFGGRELARASWLPGRAQLLVKRGRLSLEVDAETGSAKRLRDDRDAMKDAFSKVAGLGAADAERIAAGSHTSDAARRQKLVSFGDDLYLYDREARTAKRLTYTPAPERLAQFSPDGRMVAFVENHNLQVIDLERVRTRALTTEGNAELLCGELDWVYQEEIYGRGRFRAFWWSPDSRHLAFLRLDQSGVLDYTVTDHIPVRGRLEVTRYPKAGDPLPKAALGIVPASGGKTAWLDTEAYSSSDFLIVDVSWRPDSGTALVQIQDRPQTWLDLIAVPASGGAGTRLLREDSPAWVDAPGSPRFLPDGQSFLWLSARSGSRQIYEVSHDGSESRALTEGAAKVQRLYGADPKGEWVYFLASRDSAFRSDGYRVRRVDGQLERLTKAPGSHSLSFDEGYRYAIDRWSSRERPTQTRLLRSSGEDLRLIEPNLSEEHLQFARGPRRFCKVPTRDGGHMPAILLTPPDYDPSRRYPVLCYVYSGPQAASARDRWGRSTGLWHQYLAQQGICIWICDNRSAAAPATQDAWPIHRRLGEQELEDLSDGIAWLTKEGIADPDRIGIWGWSYGGYMSAYALTHSKLFKLGIAGAPVTDWRNYDAIYTERYMGLPQDNPDGYRRSSVVKAAKSLHGKLLLIHGSLDDNVHLSNTLQLAEALQRAEKDFEMMIYPKNRHGVQQAEQARHMRRLMTRFILEQL